MGTMFSSLKLSSNPFSPLMSNILRSPCSVLSRPFLARPSFWATQMEDVPEVMESLMYLERVCELRYICLALMPRMTLIMRLDFIRSSTSGPPCSRLLPTQSSAKGRPAACMAYRMSAGSRTMSRWLETARNLPSMPVRFSIPLKVNPSEVRARMALMTSIMMTAWNSSMLLTLRSLWTRVSTLTLGKRYLEIIGSMGWRETLLMASTASSSLYGRMSSNSDKSTIIYIIYADANLGIIF